MWRVYTMQRVIITLHDVKAKSAVYGHVATLQSCHQIDDSNHLVFISKFDMGQLIGKPDQIAAYIHIDTCISMKYLDTWTSPFS